MGPIQHPPKRDTDQERSHCRAKPSWRRPRQRRCLPKGCERRFRPKHAWSRYCGDECRSKARQWSRWKAQKRYRDTGAGKEHRKVQKSYRHRQRVRARTPLKTATDRPARVIKAKKYSTAPAIGRAAMCCSGELAVLRCNDSVPGSAGRVPSNAIPGSDFRDQRKSSPIFVSPPAAAD
jgi:hypothetical protein